MSSNQASTTSTPLSAGKLRPIPNDTMSNHSNSSHSSSGNQDVANSSVAVQSGEFVITLYEVLTVSVNRLM